MRVGDASEGPSCGRRKAVREIGGRSELLRSRHANPTREFRTLCLPAAPRGASNRAAEPSPWTPVRIAIPPPSFPATHRVQSENPGLDERVPLHKIQPVELRKCVVYAIRCVRVVAESCRRLPAPASLLVVGRHLAFSESQPCGSAIQEFGGGSQERQIRCDPPAEIAINGGKA